VTALARCTVTRYEIARYEIPLAGALGNAAGHLRRTGHWLTLVSEDGAEGYGDAAPLQPFSRESLSDARADLERGARLFEGSRLESVAQITELLDDDQPFCASARYALEQAALALLANTNRRPLCALLSNAPRPAVAVNALVMNPAQARGAVSAGFGQLKIKVARDAVDVDVERIAAIRRAIGPQIGLRLDANGRWSEAQAAEALCKLAPLDIDYVEQPVTAADIDALARLSRCSPIAIAADESLRSLADCRQLIAASAASVYVLKPQLCGSFQSALQIARVVHEANCATVVTSLLESPIGRYGALQLAAAIEGELRACGLAAAGELMPPGPKLQSDAELPSPTVASAASRGCESLVST
jgi:o-succinylbenzoate synthase